MKKFIFVFFIFCFFLKNTYSNIEISDTTNCKKKQIVALVSGSSAYIGSMAVLYRLWYAEYESSSFHFFNDNDQWLQMDKLGHAYSAYHIGELGYNTAKFTCFNKKQSVWIGGSAGLLFLTTIEIFDGLSDGWGASWGDMIANTTGFLLFATQQHHWGEQRFRLKFSYSQSQYAQYRPSILGGSFAESFLKDYNAQTYWMSFSPASFMQNNTFWPDWLCISLGYSGDGMLSGSAPNPTHNEDNVALPYFNRQRELLLSLDIDWQKINTNSKFLKKCFYIINIIKIPFPALYYSKTDNIKIKGLYF